MRRIRRGDDGTVTVLVIGFTAILLMLVTVVVDVSAVFLAQRSLSGAADAAAVAAANAVDEDAVYRDGALGSLPLADAAAVVHAHLAESGVTEQFPGLQVHEAASDGTTATVSLAADVALPFVGAVAPDLGSWRVRVTASARSPLDP